MKWRYTRLSQKYTAKWDEKEGDVITDDKLLREIINNYIKNKTKVQCAEVGVYLEASLDDNLRAWGTISKAVYAVSDPKSVLGPPAFISGEDDSDNDFKPTPAKRLERKAIAPLRSSGKNNK